MQSIPLTTGWKLKQRDTGRAIEADFAAPDDWLLASVPGTVHQDLLAAGRIPDPFYGVNEQAVQWVGEVDWLYRCEFSVPAGMLEATSIDLCCDGLDTFATLWLNGQQILTADNMFVPQRVPVEKLLRAGVNSLHILFESALRRGQERQEQHGPMPVWNGDQSRVYVRKAQYHYGWDWGPCLMTAGLWQAARLEAYDLRIAEVHCPAELTPDLGQATLAASVVLGGAAEPEALAGVTVQLDLFDRDGDLAGQAVLPAAARLTHTFEVEAPRLWWPRGYGQQPLYRLEVGLRRADQVLDQQAMRLGLRQLRLVQEPLADEPGTTFMFEVNHTPIFCGGANWIPADSFTPRIPPERYRALLEQAAQANMAMLRVWGGGIYEADVFYDLCDELGLLVWQDFMFACGLYPGLGWFQDSLRAEAEATVRRLRHHACLALWCGNNEDYQLASSVGAYDPDIQGDFAASRFPARAIYEQLLPEVCARLDAGRDYWPGSPYGGANGNDQTFGDRHTWDVWHGQVAPYQDYGRFGGRFVSEFGMQAAPALATLESVVPAEERYPESRTMDHHNKATDGPRRLAVYLAGNLRWPRGLEGYIYATQLVQAEALATAYTDWRRRWRGPGRYALAGALVWQLNDCWPVTSWAIIDYNQRPKAAYHVVRRALAPIALGLAPAAGGQGAEVWAVNGRLEALQAELDLRAWTLAGELAASDLRSAELLPNQATELGRFEPAGSDPVVLSARLLAPDGSVLARAALWPTPFKYYQFSDPGIEIASAGDGRLRLRAARPAKGVVLSSARPVSWSDNMLDLLPGDEQIVTAPELGQSEVQVRWLGWDGQG